MSKAYAATDGLRKMIFGAFVIIAVGVYCAVVTGADQSLFGQTVQIVAVSFFGANLGEHITKAISKKE